MSVNSLPKTTIENWLNEAAKKLKQAEISSNQLDAELILSHVMVKNREWLLAHSNETLPQVSLGHAENLLERRLKHEPLAYILGEKEFYGRNFNVTPNVLIPRPESEDFVDLLKVINQKKVIDIGTGSGCLAITAKLELARANVIATDISEPALQVARQNARYHQVNVKFLQGSLLESLVNNDLSSSAIVANLPYVPKNMVTSPEITKEPQKALFAGKNGLKIYEKFWGEVGILSTKPRYILTESLQIQHKDLEEMAIKINYRLQKTRNLIQLFETS